MLSETSDDGYGKAVPQAERGGTGGLGAPYGVEVGGGVEGVLVTRGRVMRASCVVWPRVMVTSRSHSFIAGDWCCKRGHFPVEMGRSTVGAASSRRPGAPCSARYGSPRRT